MPAMESTQPRKKPRFSRAEIQLNLCRVINHSNSARAFGDDFPQFFHITEPVPGVREVLLQRENKVVEYVNENAVTCAILRYCHHLSNVEMFRGVDEATAKSATKFWVNYTTPIPEPAMLREKSDAGMCFRRLPFDIAYQPTPVFDEVLQRTTNADSLCAFVGSLLEPAADRQQYVWLWGDGMNGKGALIRFLKRVLGAAFVSKDTPSREDRFWNYGLLGKRLVALSDCADPNFPVSQKFKMLTGGDDVSIEAKGRDAYSTSVICKFIFASNEKPAITGQISDRRRAIFCEIAPITNEPAPSGRYDEWLWHEGAGILFKCREAYRRMVGVEHGTIPADDNSMNILIEENNASCQLIFDYYFAAELNHLKLERDKMWCTPSEIASVFRLAINRGVSHRQFLKWLRIEKGVVYKPVKLENGKVSRRYVGACVCPAHKIDSDLLNEKERPGGVTHLCY